MGKSHRHRGDRKDCRKNKRKKGGNKSVYGNFWSTKNQSVRTSEAICFERSGPAKHVDLTSDNTIKIKKAGDYEVNFILTIRIDDSFREENRVAVFLNEVEVPGFQTTFFTRSVGGYNTKPVNDVINLVGTAIVSIPAKTLLQLRNSGSDEITIFGNDWQSGASLTIIKLS